MSRNQSILSREEQLKLWKEKKKATLELQRKSCSSYPSAKSLMSHTPTTRSRSAQTGILKTLNLNQSRSLEKRLPKPHHEAPSRTVVVKEIEIPTNGNADSPFHNDMVSPLASFCQNTPHGDGFASRSTHSRDIRNGNAETNDIPRHNRRRRTDFSTLLLPIPSLREHMTQSTTSPATQQDAGKVSPALSFSSQKASGSKSTCYEPSLRDDDERNSLMTPESATNGSNNSSSDPKTERLMDIDEDNCITEWAEQGVSPIVVRSRRRINSIGLLLPIPSLRDTLTPPDHDTILDRERASPSNEQGLSHEVGLAATSAPSLSPLEYFTRRRGRNRSKRPKGDMRNSRRYDSPTLLLPIPSLREEWTTSDDGTSIHSKAVPTCDGVSQEETEKSTQIECPNTSVGEPITYDAPNSIASCSLLPLSPSLSCSGRKVVVEEDELPADDGRKAGCVEAENVWSVEDVYNTAIDPFECRTSSLLECNEGIGKDSSSRSICEEYRQPAKLNGRTVLHSISEEPADQINSLKDQLDQLSVENKLLTGRMYKFRHEYEERITPFRDLFEQNTKLREENKNLILLKAENNILKSQNKEIMEGVAMLEGQTMLAIQKALERQKTLEEERDEAKSRVVELERQLQELLAK